MTFPQINIQTLFTFKRLPTLRDVLFVFVMTIIVISPVFLMALYFETLESVGFQFTLFIYIIVICSTILIASGIARVFLLINAYRQRERIFLESIGDGVCGIDTEGRIILWNTAAEIISGYSKKEMIHTLFTRVLSMSNIKDKTKERQFIENILSSRHTVSLSPKTILQTKDGKILPLGATSAPIIDRRGALRGAIIVFRDTTKEQQISRAKDEFVSLVSHQLRTPLTNMNWRLEMLLDGEAGKMSEEQKKYLMEIERGTSRMTDLVNLFLNVSRIHMGTLAITLQPSDIHGLISTTLEEFTQHIAQKKLTIKKKFDKTIDLLKCDPRIFQIIIQNILSNAIEYTPQDGTITLQTKKEDSHVIISVTDTGIGIPKKDQEKIFTKLFRAENVRENHPDGNGLGLYMVKSLLDESGGQIWFSSQEGTGTTFFISFPKTGMRARQGTRSVVATSHQR